MSSGGRKKPAMRFSMKTRRTTPLSAAAAKKAGVDGVRGLSKTQIAAFVRGSAGGKTKFQLEKEKREARAAQEAAASAKAYEEFVASFAGDSSKRRDTPKTFVAGGTIQIGADTSGTEASAGVAAPGSTYTLGAPARAPDKRQKLSQMELLMRGMDGDAPAASASAMAPPRRSGKKLRSLDLLLEEMKNAPPEKLAPLQGNSFGYAFRDQATTNLYVGNLAPTVTEEMLARKFGRYGDLISVKVRVGAPRVAVNSCACSRNAD